ncbi:Ubiquitin-related domain [Lasallia pustulata]|uniref:Ubiquitin-related domain n=1 Tax=Lasallia pustulata TaxID=136370 RepID=A0A1W5CUG5_9LECA|nr:Ubiquitin-related domain [Lasallia pustulata]
MQTAHDIPLQITSEHSASERRISPSWSVAHLKTKLEPVTGVPPSSQRLSLRVPNQSGIAIEAADEESVELASFPLQAYAEIHVEDTRPPSARANLTNVADVPKYVMPAETYSTLPDSVLAWKKANKLGRFDPHAPEIEKKKIDDGWMEVEGRGITTGKRCRLNDDDTRRGMVAFVGEVDEIPGLKGPWVGVVLDEPVGKNDGSVGGKRYFECAEKKGVFIKPERVEVGDWGVLMEEEIGEEMEEI